LFIIRLPPPEINPADKTCPGSIPGISAGDTVCCPFECKQCGGRGCASSGSAAGLGWEECCGSGVKESDIYCDESGKAPCIIGSRPPSGTSLVRTHTAAVVISE